MLFHSHTTLFDIILTLFADGFHQTGITEYRSSYSTGVTIYTVMHFIVLYNADFFESTLSAVKDECKKSMLLWDNINGLSAKLALINNFLGDFT